MSFDELAKYHSLSLMKWDEDFYASENTQLAKAFYEAGQQSKQAEVDELKKKLSDTEKWIEENKKYIAMGRWEGWTDEQYVDADDLLDVLKGESYVF